MVPAARHPGFDRFSPSTRHTIFRPSAKQPFLRAQSASVVVSSYVVLTPMDVDDTIRLSRPIPYRPRFDRNGVPTPKSSSAAAHQAVRVRIGRVCGRTGAADVLGDQGRPTAKDIVVLAERRTDRVSDGCHDQQLGRSGQQFVRVVGRHRQSRELHVRRAKCRRRRLVFRVFGSERYPLTCTHTHGVSDCSRVFLFCKKSPFPLNLFLLIVLRRRYFALNVFICATESRRFYSSTPPPSRQTSRVGLLSTIFLSLF